MSHRLAMLSSFLVFGVGCDELAEYLPKVRFDSFEVNHIDFDRIDTDFVFAVDNPNPVTIDVSSFSYDLAFEEISILAGDNDDGIALEAVGASEFALPVSMRWEDAWKLIQATRGKDDIGFGVAGDFGFDTSEGEILIPYSAGGDFPAVRAPKFSLAQVRVQSLDLLADSASLAIDLDIDNAHESTLFFQDVDYRIGLGGTRVATGLIPDLGGVDGATTQRVSIPIDISLLNSSAAVIDALTGGGSLNVTVDADMDVDSPFGVLPLSVDQAGNVRVNSP
jgi:LEA14-like dessication related protein